MAPTSRSHAVWVGHGSGRPAAAAAALRPWNQPLRHWNSLTAVGKCATADKTVDREARGSAVGCQLGQGCSQRAMSSTRPANRGRCTVPCARTQQGRVAISSC